MSTIGEDLAAATALAQAESRLVLKGWEIHVLTALTFTPTALHLFEDRLRPEVLKLAEAIVLCLQGKDSDVFPGRLAMARDFIAEVDRVWPERRLG